MSNRTPAVCRPSTQDYHEVWVQGLRARDEADARKRVEDAIPPDPGYRFEITED